jgi:tetratricopeptide (TPR) repeat protein
MRKIWVLLIAALVIAIHAAVAVFMREAVLEIAGEVTIAIEGPWSESIIDERCRDGGRRSPGKTVDACTRLIERGNTYALDDARNHVDRGNAFMYLHEYARAIADYDRAIELDPKHVNAFYNRGLARESLQEYQDALKDYASAIALAPEHVKALINRGGIYQRLNDHDAAIADFDRALAISPTEPLAYGKRSLSNRYLKNFDRAFADAERAISLAPNYGYAYRQRALIHLERQQFEAAIADFGRSLELDPSEDILYYERAQAWERFGKPDMALADLNRGVVLDPGYAPYLVARARLYLGFERWADAIRDLTQVLAATPSHIQALKLRAEAYEKSDQRGRAIADLRAVLRLNPYDHTSVDALRRLDAPTKTTVRDSCADFRVTPIDRLADCTRKVDAAATAEQRAAALYARSNVHLALNDSHRALEDMELAVKLRPEWVNAYMQRGSILMRFGEYARAVADFDRVLALDPKYPAGVYINRALALIELQRYVPALADLERAGGMSGGNPLVFYARGLAHERMGNRDKAIGDYREALKLIPSYAPAQDGLRRLGAAL